MITAIAVVVADASGRVIPGVVGKLETTDGMELLMIVTNNDGFDEFKRVPLSFTGTLKLTSGVAYYEQPIFIADGSVNVTLRVGPTHANPQDILLPPATPSFG